MIVEGASIKFRKENELMEKAEDPEKYYIEVIMQEKIKLYLEYVENHSFWGDVGLIFKTFLDDCEGEMMRLLRALWQFCRFLVLS